MAQGYKINFNTNTLVMNYKFAAAAQVYGSPEYELRKAILADFPTMNTIIRAGRTVKKARPNKRLTYENMVKYIRTYSNAEELLAVFEEVKQKSQAATSPYKYVRDWFSAQFPDYKAVPLFQNEQLYAVPVVPPEVTNKKEAADTEKAVVNF